MSLLRRIRHLEDHRKPGEVAYAVDPRSYLVVGNMSELVGNRDKVACFELYRRNVRSTEILTFDELYERAKCIVDNISHEASPDPVPDQSWDVSAW